MTDAYRPPVNLADPHAAALDHLVRAPEAMTGMRFRGLLQDLAAILDAEGALNGLGWPDARQVAATISFDAMVADDPSVTLRSRAQLVLARRDGQPWCDRTGVVRALNVAATVLDTW
jgi:hypothetical protein